jgi:hypothetical protein
MAAPLDGSPAGGSLGGLGAPSHDSLSLGADGLSAKEREQLNLQSSAFDALSVEEGSEAPARGRGRQASRNHCAMQREQQHSNIAASVGDRPLAAATAHAASRVQMAPPRAACTRVIASAASEDRFHSARMHAHLLMRVALALDVCCMFGVVQRARLPRGAQRARRRQESRAISTRVREAPSHAKEVARE